MKYTCTAIKGLESIIQCGLTEKQKDAFIKKYEKLGYSVISNEIKSIKSI